MEKVKDNMTSELARLSQEAEKLEILTSKHEDLSKKFSEIEVDYQTMLTVSISRIPYDKYLNIYLFRCMAKKRKKPRNCVQICKMSKKCIKCKSKNFYGNNNHRDKIIICDIVIEKLEVFIKLTGCIEKRLLTTVRSGTFIIIIIVILQRKING